MATFLGAPTLLVFGRFEVRTPAKVTALALLKLLFRQFQRMNSRKSGCRILHIAPVRCGGCPGGAEHVSWWSSRFSEGEAMSHRAGVDSIML